MCYNGAMIRVGLKPIGVWTNCSQCLRLELSPLGCSSRGLSLLANKITENHWKIAEIIYTLSQKGHFWHVLTIYCIFCSHKNSWNQLNNWKNQSLSSTHNNTLQVLQRTALSPTPPKANPGHDIVTLERTPPTLF